MRNNQERIMMFELVDKPAEASAFYPLLSKQAEALITGEPDTLANLSNIASLLYLSLEQVNWVGFYIVRGRELVLGPFQGKPACVRIPFGKGVCGTVAQNTKPLLVNDVLSFPGHIACDAQSRSEVVIPLFQEGHLMAVLDIDSPVEGRFSDQDLAGIHALCLSAEKKLNFAQLSYD